MNEKFLHSFEGVCPLASTGVYGIKKRFAHARSQLPKCVFALASASTCRIFRARTRPSKYR